MKKYYIEYVKDKYRFKMGDLNYLSAYGLAINTYDDQTLDFNNMLRGIEVNYNISDDIMIKGMVGSGQFNFRSKASLDSSDFYYDKQTSHFEIQNNTFIGNDFFYISNITYSFLFDKTINYYDQIFPNYIISLPHLLVRKELNGRLSDIASANVDIVDLNDKTHSFSMQFTLNETDFYMERTWINYQKILSDDNEVGSRFYFSIYRNILEFDITYDHALYNAPFQISNIVNPPICMYENNSALTSRTTTTIDFNNAIANQIEVRKFFGDIEWLFNASLFYKKVPHDDDGHLVEGNANYLEIFNFNIDNLNSYNNIKYYHPIKKLYSEISRWFFDSRLFFKIGIAAYNNLSSEVAVEKSYTIPIHYSYKINNGSTLTGYLEYQSRSKEQNLFQEYPDYYSKLYDTYYSSFSYSFNYNYVISVFQEIENYSYDDGEIENGKKTWKGIQFSMRFLNNNSIEAFYGSQRGGLVCANGVCGVYPGFKDGFKVTLRLNYDM